MDVDDHFADAKGTQAGEGDFEERAPTDFDQSLGAIVGERAKPRAEAGGEDHGFHASAFMRQPSSKTLKPKRDPSGRKRAKRKRSSHPRADPFGAVSKYSIAGAKGKEKIGLLGSE